jgi:hypothetical protein
MPIRYRPLASALVVLFAVVVNGLGAEPVVGPARRGGRPPGLQQGRRTMTALRLGATRSTSTAASEEAFWRRVDETLGSDDRFM